MVQVVEGPPVVANWIAVNNGHPCLFTHEYPLFTDAHIVAEAAHGPYAFFNTVPMSEPGVVVPSIVLRCSHYLPPVVAPDWIITDAELYHGGSFPEEIAALVSLVLGIRVRAGGVTRRFEIGGDPMGRPVEGSGRPATGVIRKERRGWVLPNAAQGDHSLEWLSLLDSLPTLPMDHTITLIRAARLYQDALWVVESEPALAWLMLVSAAESAANQWCAARETPVDRLKHSKPVLYGYLETLSSPEILSTVARHIADSLGVTKKFVDFIIEFLTPPPSARPPEWCQYCWEATNIREGMRLIYNYRSRALHDGKPFPAPMCEVPGRDAGWDAAQERMIASAVSKAGGMWLAKDIPMLFHTFEYIVRNALLEWWRRGTPEQNKTGKVPAG